MKNLLAIVWQWKRSFPYQFSDGVEPCPVAPYSDINVKDTSLLEVLDLKLFKSLGDSHILLNGHDGGDVLF